MADDPVTCANIKEYTVRKNKIILIQLKKIIKNNYKYINAKMKIIKKIFYFQNKKILLNL
jgi:hypothetical protein